MGRPLKAIKHLDIPYAVERIHLGDVRRRKFREQGGRCHYCGRGMTLKWRKRQTPPPNGATIDHVKPRCAGGTDDESNLVVCCAACNAAKGRVDSGRVTA